MARCSSLPGTVAVRRVIDDLGLVVADQVQVATMAVMAIADTATFDLASQRGRRY